MWIIPKTLSAFVPGTPGWSLESSEQAWMFAQSVTWRSKFMSKQYWLKRFKKGDYVQHLSGLTLSPSMHDHFVESWTESQEVSHVSHFQAPENEKDKKTQGTYGQASQMQFDFADPDGSSSKTCQDWLPLGCVTSCKTWDKWVTERRGVYSVRKKLALHTKGNECSSWPTPQASEGKANRHRNNPNAKGSQEWLTTKVMDTWSTPQARDWKGAQGRAYKGEAKDLPAQTEKNWATPQASDHIEGARTAKESNQKCLGRDLNQMNWATPNTMDHLPPKTGEALARNKKKGGCKNLREDVNNPKMNWPTPRAGNPGSRKPGTGGKILAEEAKIHNGLQDQEKSNTSGKNQGSPKLNPNWVEQLMGLSTGWTDLGSWGTEYVYQQQN